MNTFNTFLRGPRRLFSPAHVVGVLAALVLFAGVLPTPVEAQVRRGFVGRGFGGPRLGIGLGLGFGLGLIGGVAYSNVYADSPVYVYTPAPPVYYYAPQVAPQYVVVQQPAPVVQQTAPVFPASAASVTPPMPAAAVASTPLVAGKTGRIVYDANAKPVGVIVLNADGSQEFIPLAP